MNSTVLRAGKPAIMLLLVSLLVCGVSAATIDPATVYAGNTTSVLDSPYLDINIWFFITAIGIGLIILSNRVKSEPENALYAWLAIPFTLVSAYYSLRLQYTETTVLQDTSGLIVVNNSTVPAIHIQTVNTITHPEVIAILMGIVFLVAFVNAIYITIKRPVERSNPMEQPGKNE